MVVLIMDFDLRRHAKKPSFTAIFTDVFIYASSLFIGFSWSDLFKQAMLQFLPEGQGIISKSIVLMVVTMVMVVIVYLILRISKPKEVSQ
jgi:hypothetical protein